MKRLSIKFLIIGFILLFPVVSFAQNSFPSFPMAFWGTAKLNNNNLPVGTKIQTYCGANLIDEIILETDGIYGSTDLINGDRLLASNCDSNIIFKYVLIGTSTALTGGENIIESFVSGETKNKNLNFVTIRSCIITNGTGSQIWNSSVWGNCAVISCNSSYHQSGNICVADSSSGNNPSGGNTTGGGSPPPTTKTGDANGDNKIDKYDFSLMMANWGKTGTNSCDFNNDGKVDKYDFALLMSKWGT